MTTPAPPKTYQSLKTHQAKVDRCLGIGGSDANRIVRGDTLELWREKTGKRAPADLSNVFRVQLGLLTEPFHLEWHSLYETTVLSSDNEPMYSPGVTPEGWMYASLDGWVLLEDVPIEVKHTNEHNHLRGCAEYYMGQLQHIMLVTGTDRIRFSIIRGNNEPEWGYVAADRDYQKRLLAMEQNFWFHVTEDVAPPAQPQETEALAEAAKQIPINGLKPYDLSSDNEFCSLAVDYLTLKPQAARFEDVKKELKAKVPADASEVTCPSIVIKRSANGALRFQETA